MAVDPNIKQKADDIRTKVYGSEVRESLASGLEAMSSDVVENESRQSVVESRQDSVESQFQDVIENTTDKDVVSAPEIITARNGEPNLKARLDKENQEVTAQLAQTAQELDRVENKVYTKSTYQTKPLVSFYLDDGYSEDYTVVFPKAQSLGFPITICLHNEEQSWLSRNTDELFELVDAGWEVHGHTEVDQDLRNLSYEEQYETMKNNKDFLESIGLEVKGVTYPRGFANSDSLRAARELFEVGMGSDYGVINESPIDTYFIYRELVDMYSLSTLKTMVDEVTEKGGWIVFYTHTGQFPTNQDKFFDLMDYVATKNIDVVTVGEAMEYYANTLDLGDRRYNTGDYAKIGRDGKVDITNLPISVADYGREVNERLGTEYPAGKLTINPFANNRNSDIPYNSGIGTLYTDRIYENRNQTGTLATQRFEGAFGTVVTRQYNTPTGWSEWVGQGGLNTIKSKPYTVDSPITDFPNNKVTSVGFLSSDNSGFPNGGIGTLITSRIGANNVLGYQVFYPYNTNMYSKRYWNGTDWSKWDTIRPTTSTYFASHDFGSISNQSSTYEFEVPVAISGSVTLNFPQGLPSGVIPVANVIANNKVSVVLNNVTGSSVSVGARNIRLITQ